MKKPLKKYRKQIITTIAFVCALHFYFSLPSTLFNTPYSKVLFASNGEILSVKIAEDEQWRIPLKDSLSYKYKTCLINFEDEGFNYHLGVNPLSIGRAFYQNIAEGKVKSGGSTISMQIVRMSRDNPPRTIWEKVKEIYLATRIEFSYSKNEILKLYANHAPFGGNVVGIIAAGWKYFGRPITELSWAEAATLAVLPNSPSLIFPGKNQHLLQSKRNFLLNKLHRKGIIDATTLSLAKEEPLPQEFISYPRHASHALEYISKTDSDNLLKTSLDFTLQNQCNRLLQHYISDYAFNHIHNGAIIVIDNHTKQVLSYVGNSQPTDSIFHENYVDLIQAPRSTGSILKPFLHASALDDGLILNQSLLPDIPTIIQGFAPKNYTKSYEGAVKANAALARSLNIPAVRLLQKYSYPRFHAKLKDLGLSTLQNEADHYGLSLILGGAEATLWDLGKMYSGMASTLTQFEKAPLNKSYSDSFFASPTFSLDKKEDTIAYTNHSKLRASSIFETFQSLLELKRPTEEGDWKLFENSKKIAWKTGTSHGFRDAWAVGVTPRYTVGVWVGNATGEGRPGLVGVKKAAPLLFSVFNLLPNSNWFKAPKRNMYYTPVCHHSGNKASEHCENIDTVLIGNAGKRSDLCTYCQTVSLNKEGLQVNSSCYTVSNMKQESFFILPPIQEWYYIQKSANYKRLPGYAKGCVSQSKGRKLGLIYPQHNAKIYIPRQIEGTRSQLICEATHTNKSAPIYWHIDNQYLGETTDRHQMAIDYEKGRHTLMIIDSEGQQQVIQFDIL